MSRSTSRVAGRADRRRARSTSTERGRPTIVVAPGANAALQRGRASRARRGALPARDSGRGRYSSAWEGCNGDLLPERSARAARLPSTRTSTVVNRLELEDAVARRDGLVAVTLGAEGAVPARGRRGGRARDACLASEVVDGTAAPVMRSTACLLVSLLEEREYEEALERACAAGALAASRFGAQPSLPTAAEVDASLPP